MANTFITPTDVIHDANLILRDRLVAANLVSRDTEARFARKVGDTVKVSVPAIVDGKEFTGTASASDIAETTVDVVLEKHFYNKVSLTSDELSQQLDDFNTRVQIPVITGLVGKIENYLISKIAGGFARNIVGTAGTDPSTHQHIINAEKKVFDNQGDTSLLAAILNSQAHANFKVLNIMNSLDFREDAPSILRGNALGQTNNISFVRSVHAGTFDQGDVAGTVLVNGASQTGSNLAVDGFTASTGTVKEGTRFTVNGIAGVTFTVTADTAIASNAATLPITPALPSSPADNAAVTFETAFTEIPVYNPAAVAGAFVPGAPDINAEISSIDGIGLRVIRGGVDTTSLASDWVWDLYVGCRVVQPAFGAIMQG